MIRRQDIINRLVEELNSVDYINAMWEGGSEAFGRTDKWSDIDLGVDVKDENVEEAFTKIEDILKGISPIKIKYRLPDPTWHGNPQAFYLLENTSPFLMIDLSVIPEIMSLSLQRRKYMVSWCSTSIKMGRNQKLLITMKTQ